MNVAACAHCHKLIGPCVVWWTWSNDSPKTMIPFCSLQHKFAYILEHPELE